MAITNFATLTEEHKTIWAMDFWKTARNMSFINQFVGTKPNSVIQRITDLRKDVKGARAVMTLVADLTEDGVTGDYTQEGFEEELQSFEQVIRIDQLRNAVRQRGRLAEQKTVVSFREHARDKLAYWIADRCDQLALLTMAGMPYTLHNNGHLRTSPAGTGRKLADLEFSADVVAPSTNRHLRWDLTNKKLVAGSTTSVTAGDKLNYEAIVRLGEFAQNHYIKGIRTGKGEEMFYLFVTPSQFADLQLDQAFLDNVRNAGVRGTSNPLFRGLDRVVVDGVMIIKHRHVPNTSEAETGTSGNAGDAGYKWGAAANVNGARALFCGAQALGMVDLMGSSGWEEEAFDYGNQPGINVYKMLGFLKPQFNAAPRYTSKEDFGVVALDTATQS